MFNNLKILKEKMKKTIFSVMFAMILGSVMVSCGNKTEEGAGVDSTLVDTTVVDSVVVDSIAVDSVCAE